MNRQKRSPDGIKLKNVSIRKQPNNNNNLYFLLQIGLLMMTIVIFIGACVGIWYFFYKLVIGNRERYFQFEDKPNDAVVE